MISNRTFLAAGVLLALVIAVTAVFFASGDPDGLDSTALITQGQKDLTSPAGPDAEVDEGALPGSFEYQAPFPDYTLEGGSKLTDVGVIMVGTLVALLLVFLFGRGLKAFNRSRSS